MTEIIVNHPLFYVANKYVTTAKDKLVENLVKFYTVFDELNDAKKILCEKANKNSTTRRGDDKATKTAHDIIETFISCDNCGTTLPTFVATSYARIPLTTDGAVTMEQLLCAMNAMNARIGDVEKTLRETTSSRDTTSPSTLYSSSSPASSSPAASPSAASELSASASAASASAASSTASLLAASLPPR